MIQKAQVLNYLQSQDLCVLSTVSPLNKSESAVMAYSVTDDFIIYMSSEPNTRKIVNLKSNPSASVVIGGLKNDPSVQLDGTIDILLGQSAQKAKEIMLSLHPQLETYLSSTTIYFQFKPSWLRYSDFSQNPPLIIEFAV